jgi:hypothetical protein
MPRPNGIEPLSRKSLPPPTRKAAIATLIFLRCGPLQVAVDGVLNELIAARLVAFGEKAIRLLFLFYLLVELPRLRLVTKAAEPSFLSFMPRKTESPGTTVDFFARMGNEYNSFLGYENRRLCGISSPCKRANTTPRRLPDNCLPVVPQLVTIPVIFSVYVDVCQQPVPLAFK